MGAVSMAFHVLTLSLWGVAGIINVPSLYALLRGKARHNDIVWARDFFIATMLMGFGARWIIFPQAYAVMQPDEILLWIGLQTFSCICALSVIGTRLGYGR